MKRILVLGSKPGARFVDAAEAWCANAAIGFYADEVRRYPVVVNVASAVILRKNASDASSHGGLYAKKWRAVTVARPARLILLSAPGDPGCAAGVEAALRAAGYAAPIEHCSVRRRTRLVPDLAGVRYPVVTRALLRQPLAVQLRDIERIVRFIWKSRRGAEHEDAPGKFRPSTGVLALLLAIAEHGSAADYVLAGIGVAERWAQHAAGTVLVGKTATRHGGLTPHVHADVVILRALAARYAVTTTEPELAGVVPPFAGSVVPAGDAVAPGPVAA